MSTANPLPPETSSIEPAPASVVNEARDVGRGGLAITFAKIYFILQGLVQQVLLPRVLGLDGYGALSSVLSAASITYNPIVTTSIQGVSRAVAQADDANRPATVRRVFIAHAVLAALSAAGFFAAAPSLAEFMRAPHLTTPFRWVSLVLLFYGLYAPLVGVLNGQRRFVAQAAFDVVFGTVRTVALVVGGLLLARVGRGVEGSVLGFVGVSAGVAVVAAFVVGTGRAGAGGSPMGAHLRFVWPLLLGQILLNCLLQADITLLRRFAGEAAELAGLAPSAADPLVGAYRVTQLFSFLPYQLLVSVTFVLFPMLAAAHKAGDRAAVARYVTAGVRIALVLAGAMVSVTSGLSGPLIRLVYSPEAAELGTHSMQVLTLGLGAFAILGVLTAVLSSLGREREGAAVLAVAFALVVGLCFARVRGAPFGEELLFKTAWSTAAGLALATSCAAILVRRAVGAVVSWSSLLRVASAMAVAICIGRVAPVGGRVSTVLLSLVVALIYLAVLVITRELGSTELAFVRGVVSRRR